MSRWAVLGIAVALGGCNAGDPSRDNAAVENRSILAEAPANESAEAPKSILRPEVVPEEPEKPVLKPIERIIPFGTSGLKLDDAARQSLDTVLADPAMAAGGAVTLRGHTDTRGYDGDNLVVSRKRAQAVRDYLVEKGVASDRITLIALGETRPIAPNAKPDGSDDPEGRAKNRRVEVEVALPKPAPTETPAAAPENGTAETPGA